MVPTKTMVKKYTAYIQQQDCFFGSATVAETILFSAMMKLPADTPDKQGKVGRQSDKISHIDSVISHIDMFILWPSSISILSSSIFILSY